MAKLNSQVSALAATRAAVDPERAAWQNDVLITGIIETLGRRGASSAMEIVTELRTAWSSTVTRALVERALETARKAELVEVSQRGKANPKWYVTDSVSEEAGRDREWAKQAISAFETETLVRMKSELGDVVDGMPLEKRLERIVQQIIMAIAHAAAGLAEAAAGDPNQMDVARINVRGALPDFIESIQPKSLSETVAGLLIAAANPHDSYGNEIVRMMVTGQILYGMVCRDDVRVQAPPSLLLLDTSELVALVAADDVTRVLFRDFLQTATARGCRVVVTDGVSNEWKRLWEQADDQVELLDGEPAWAGDFLDNPMARAFESVRESRPDISWPTWANSKRRSLSKQFERLEVKVERGDTLTPDPALVQAIEQDLSQVLPGRDRPIKFPAQAHTDAVSASLVAAERGEQASAEGVPVAWFVAADLHTARAYAKSVPHDPYPLTTTSTTWLLHYAAFGEAPAKERVELAQRMSEGILLESFLSVCASYTAEDVLSIKATLGDDAEYDEEDMQDAISAAFITSPDLGSDARVAEYLRRRGRRRDRRALLAREEASKVTIEAQKRVSSTTTASKTRDADHEKTVRRLVSLLWLLATAFAITVAWLTRESFGIKDTTLGFWLVGAGLAMFVEVLRYYFDSSRKGIVAILETASLALFFVAPFVYDWLKTR